jgi:predicted TIM-barrel fold metal-dependent hydrolase
LPDRRNSAAQRTPDDGRLAGPVIRTPLRLPANAVDCHVHVFDPARFPFAKDTAYQPVPAECGNADDLAAVLDASGIDRVVLVNATSGYGDDNRCMVDALARLGPRARGIARVPLTIAPRALTALARRGVVGVRIDCVGQGLGLLDDPALPRFLAALADRDLVLDVQGEAAQWGRIVDAIGIVPVRVAIDHCGRPRPADGVNAPGFKALLRIAQSGRVVVKLSGPMRYSQKAPPYRDVDPYLRALVREYTPARLVWGSDWPFLRGDRRFDYAPLLALLADAVPSARDRRSILSATPAHWFGFQGAGHGSRARRFL